MGWQIVKQDDGKYAIWSSVVDAIIVYDCTRRDIVREFMKEYERTVVPRINGFMDELDKGGKPYYQFTLDRDEIHKALVLARHEYEKEQTERA